MATEQLTLHETPGKTIYYRLFRPTDGYVFDFDDDTWKVNLAACTTYKLSASENTDVGDSAFSIYSVGLDLETVNSSDTPMYIIVQAVEDLATDVILNWLGFWLANGENVGEVTGSNVAMLLGSSDDAVRLGHSVSAIEIGSAITGTLTTTQFTTDLTEVTDNHYGSSDVQAVCAFYTGALARQSRPIVAYDGTSKKITVDPAFTDAPSNGDDFVILGLMT